MIVAFWIVAPLVAIAVCAIAVNSPRFASPAQPRATMTWKRRRLLRSMRADLRAALNRGGRR